MILDGKAVSQTLKKKIASEVEEIIRKNKRAPHLVTVLVGDNTASMTYVRNKIKSCEKVNMRGTLIHKSADITENELLDLIDKLNKDSGVDGYIVQLPLPKHIDKDKINLAIDPIKDVDGFHPLNLGKMTLGLPTYLPATPYGIIKLLEHYEIETKGKNCVVLGRSAIVGRPVSILLSNNHKYGNCTVTVLHSKSKDKEIYLKNADIIISAIGIPQVIKKDMVKKGAVLIDVGMNRVEDKSKKRGYRLVGDADYEELKDHCSAITPVPGGVGPMTVTSLLLNTLKAAKKVKEN